MATVRVTPEMAKRAVREADWARLDAQTDEEIARNVAGDPDAAPILTDAETAAAEAEEARPDAEALADYRAGRTVPHAKVARWLDSWGTENELPSPKPEPR